MKLSENKRDHLHLVLNHERAHLKRLGKQINLSIEKLNEKDLHEKMREDYQKYLDSERIESALTESRIKEVQEMLSTNTFKATCLDMWDD